MNNGSDIFYSLCTDDIQTVAVEEFGRELSVNEVEKIKDLIGEKIDWYYIIADTIREELGLVGVE